jgi:hypothetical protein
MADIGNKDLKANRTYRATLAAVIFLSALMGLALIALALGFMRQYRLYQADRNGPVSLQLAPGAHIVSAGIEAGRLVLHVQTPAGGEVEIMDSASGKLISRTGGK